jgi:hypothetical protein
VASLNRHDYWILLREECPQTLQPFQSGPSTQRPEPAADGSYEDLLKCSGIYHVSWSPFSYRILDFGDMHSRVVAQLLEKAFLGPVVSRVRPSRWE